MHEFDTTARLFKLALEKADLTAGERIRRINMILDPDCGYTPEAIRFYFEQLAQNTPAEGADLAFDVKSHTQHIGLVSIDVDEQPTTAGTDSQIASRRDSDDSITR